ncbi:HU family DNA-binding protein [Streptomyces mirabilis]|uniref:HU family DNA-binding protein n=1 Tax=Streptomyces mirabilis TaxID=68239 RepID=UPI0036C81D26
MPSTRGPLNQTQLIEAVAAELDWPAADADRAVRATLDVIAATLAAGHNVSITNFGTFISRRVQARKARNPQTGGRVQVREHQALRFRPAPRLRQVVRRRGGSIRKHPKSQPGAER